MTREEIIRNLKYTMEKHKNDTVNTFGTNISVMCKDILDYLEQELCEDAISRQAAIRIAEQGQVQGYEWQFKELNKLQPLNPQPCIDVISRQEVLKLQYRIDDSATLSTRDVVNVEDIEELPSVTPAENSVYRKKAKRWKKKYFALKTEIEKAKAEIDSYCSENRDRNDGLYIAIKIIDKHTKGKEKEQ